MCRSEEKGKDEKNDKKETQREGYLRPLRQKDMYCIIHCNVKLHSTPKFMLAKNNEGKPY